jgi:hypothetical protein
LCFTESLEILQRSSSSDSQAEVEEIGATQSAKEDFLATILEHLTVKLLTKTGAV